jgi:biopolymer transport protein ExbB
MRVFDLVVKGGPVMIPIIVLSVVTLGFVLDRAIFWVRSLRRANTIVKTVLEAARYDLREAETIAEKAQEFAIGRFLLSPLRLKNPTPETFHLALKSTADQEFAAFRKSNIFLGSVVGVAPFLGLLGTVTALVTTFRAVKASAGQSADVVTQAAGGIGDALITAASGIVVATLALAAFFALMVLHARQRAYFAKTGDELESIFRQVWYEPSVEQSVHL